MVAIVNFVCGMAKMVGQPGEIELISREIIKRLACYAALYDKRH